MVELCAQMSKGRTTLLKHRQWMNVQEARLTSKAWRYWKVNPERYLKMMWSKCWDARELML